MAGLRAFLGFFPKTSDYETKRLKLDEEYNELLDFRSSKELNHFQELEDLIKSEKFTKKKQDVLNLRFKNTEDYQKEKEYKSLVKAKDIKLYLKTVDSEELKRFNEIEKSDTLAEYQKLEAFVKSDEFANAKKAASAPAKEKFQRSDLAKTLEQYNSQKDSAQIKGYQAFTSHKLYPDFEQAIKEGLPDKIERLAKEGKDTDEYKALVNSTEYKRYYTMVQLPEKKYYDDLHGSPEIEAFIDLSSFIQSADFKRQRKEIEKSSFRDTEEYKKLEEFERLRKSDEIKFYLKFKSSKAYKNYLNLKDSDRLAQYETLKKFIEGDEFIRFKEYATKSPKKRWAESTEGEKEKEYEELKKSEKIKWYFKNIESPRFNWHRHWKETFADDFSEKSLDTSKWMTRYYYGDKMLKESYSLSRDKHYVTDGENVEINTSKLVITLRKEDKKGKSWDPAYGFISREFGYTSGLVNTGKSFRQKFGTFEAKIKIVNSKEVVNAFWMVGKKQIPHINIMKAYKKFSAGNIWGDAGSPKSAQQFKKTYKRGKFVSDYFIYTLEWTPEKLTWKINGIEIATSASGLPEEPLYIALSSGLQKDLMGTSLPAKMEVDWVKCYQRNDLAEKEV